MSFARSRAMPPERARAAKRRMSRRMPTRHDGERLGQRRLGVGRAADGGLVGVAVVGRVAEPIDGGVDRRRVHRPRGRRQLVLVVAAMPELVKERCHRRLQRGSRGSARRCRRARRRSVPTMSASVATSRESRHSSWAIRAESTSPVPPTIRLASPGGASRRSRMRSMNPRGAAATKPARSRRAMLARQPRRVRAEPRQQRLVAGRREVGHGRQPGLALRSGPRRATPGRAPASSEIE